ncbi:MAG: nucleoid-associated protein, YbaB/EbfC family [Deltaproteobacteria bacterium GWC2_42_11]|nr:MAG: nucleoid-associated protein, YbaB/EbfC family [Deltaproteobacteria bacterium GWC2_42_11]HBO84798.1 YbaB/EbfC family nucleoid-associated protein [Deltaproteobacteria bacterium]
MKNLGNILRQAQKMQEKMAQVQQELAARTVEASSGGGMVTVTVNGKQEVILIKIDHSVVNPQDIDMLQDLIAAAVNSAIKKSQEMMTEEMGKVTAGLNMNIPGLF